MYLLMILICSCKHYHEFLQQKKEETEDRQLHRRKKTLEKLIEQQFELLEEKQNHLLKLTYGLVDEGKERETDVNIRMVNDMSHLQQVSNIVADLKHELI